MVAIRDEQDNEKVEDKHCKKHKNRKNKIRNLFMNMGIPQN